MVDWPWPVQDGHDNERVDDSLSGESDQLEQKSPTLYHAFKSIRAAHQKNYQHPLEKAYVNLHEHDKPVNVRNGQSHRIQGT